jgi:hypothetical protein
MIWPLQMTSKKQRLRRSEWAASKSKGEKFFGGVDAALP